MKLNPVSTQNHSILPKQNPDAYASNCFAKKIVKDSVSFTSARIDYMGGSERYLRANGHDPVQLFNYYKEYNDSTGVDQCLFINLKKPWTYNGLKIWSDTTRQRGLPKNDLYLPQSEIAGKSTKELAKKLYDLAYANFLVLPDTYFPPTEPPREELQWP